MIRPIGLLDVPSISRLQNQGVQLDLRRALTLPESPLAVVLRAPLAFTHPLSYTYIGQQDLGADHLTGFVQLRCRPVGRPQADITYISPGVDAHTNMCALWTQLLNAVCWEAGRHGVQQVFADLPADSESVTPFLNAGFMVFAREELLACEPQQISRSPVNLALRRQRDTDLLALQRLYATIVPVGVKQVEGAYEANGAPTSHPNRSATEEYVLEIAGEIAGHVEIVRGKIGHCLNLAIRPDAVKLAGNAIAAGLQLLPDALRHPVYCHIRTYQSCLRQALFDLGFKVIDVRDIAVRQTLARIERPVLGGMKVLDSRSEVSVTPTISPHWQQTNRR